VLSLSTMYFLYKVSTPLVISNPKVSLGLIIISESPFSELLIFLSGEGKLPIYPLLVNGL
jgi:hypothetical protein